MRRAIHIISIGLMFSCSVTEAQDFHLTQYLSAPQHLNPAETGVYSKNSTDWRGSLNYRSQWFASSGSGFNSAHTAFDTKKGYWGFGGYINNNRAFRGGYNSFNANFSGSYDVMGASKSKHHLLFGAQMGLLNVSLRPDEYSYDSQYDPLMGFDLSRDNLESFVTQSLFRVEGALGVLYTASSPYDKVEPRAGYSVFHITRPNTSIFDNTREPIPLRHVLYGGAKIEVNESLNVEPRLLLMFQGQATDVNINAIGYYDLNQDWTAMLGAGYRWQDAVLIYVGAQHGNNTYVLSYDINTSEVATYSNGIGGIEFSITITGAFGSVVQSGIPRV